MKAISNTDNNFSFTPSSFSEAMDFAKVIAKSDLVPKDYKDKPENVMIAMQWGMELNLKPLQAIQNIAVINGRPSIWGDAQLAIVQQHPAYEWHKEIIENEGTDQARAIFQIKRQGHEIHTSIFSIQDAKKAGLWDKVGPWKFYPYRMLQMRARGFGLRDKFADALKGFISIEEARDLPVEKNITNIGEATVIDPTTKLGALALKLKSESSEETTNEIKAIAKMEENIIDGFKNSIDASNSLDELEKIGNKIKDSSISDEGKKQLKILYNGQLKKLKEIKSNDDFIKEMDAT